MVRQDKLERFFKNVQYLRVKHPELAKISDILSQAAAFITNFTLA
jgi:hypothetical protein